MNRILSLSLLLLPLAAQAQITRDAEGTITVDDGVTTLEVDNATHSEGDLLLGIVAINDNRADVAPAETGWAKDDEAIDGDNGLDRTVIISSAIAGASEPAAITHNHGGLNTKWIGQIHAFSGMDGTTPLYGFTDPANNSGTPDVQHYSSVPGVTTLTNGDWACTAIVAHDYNGSGPSVDQGFTIYTSPDDGSDSLRIGLACKEIATAGVVTMPTWSNVGSATPTTDISATSFAIAVGQAGISFPTPPTASPIVDGIRATGEVSCTGTCTVYGVGVNPGDGTPTCTQIKAGQNDAGVAADLSNSAVWTTDTPGQTLDLTKSGAWPRYDIHICASDGTNDTAVVPLPDEDRSADTNQSIVELLSVDPASRFAVQSVTTADVTLDSNVVCDVASLLPYIQPGMRVDMAAGYACSSCIVEGEDAGAGCMALEEDATSNQTDTTAAIEAYYDPTVAGGFMVELDDQTSDAKAASLATDGLLTITSIGTNPQTLDYNIQRVTGDDGNMTAGPPPWTAGDDKFYFNVERPNFGFEGDQSILVYLGEQMTPVSLDCTDPQGYTTTTTARGSLPSGLSVDSAGEITGEPLVENETGETDIFDCVAASGLYATRHEQNFYVTDDQVEMVSIIGLTVSAALDAIAARYPWLPVSIDVKGKCDNSATEGIILTQKPAALSTTTAEPTFSATIANSKSCAAERRRGRRHR